MAFRISHILQWTVTSKWHHLALKCLGLVTFGYEHPKRKIGSTNILLTRHIRVSVETISSIVPKISKETWSCIWLDLMWWPHFLAVSLSPVFKVVTSRPTSAKHAVFQAGHPMILGRFMWFSSIASGRIPSISCPTNTTSHRAWNVAQKPLSANPLPLLFLQ